MDKNIILELMDNKVGIKEIKDIIKVFDKLNIEYKQVFLSKLRKYEFNKGLIKFLCNNKDNLNYTACELEKIIEELGKCNFNDRALEYFTSIKGSRTVSEQIELFELLRNNNLDKDVLAILINEDVLYYVSFLGQLELVDKFIKNGKGEYALKLITNRNILENKNINEIVEMLDKLKECNFYVVLNLMCDEGLLLRLNNEDHLKLVDELKKCSYNCLALSIVIDENVVYERNADDIVKLVEKLRECDFDDYVIKLACDPQILRYMNINEQIIMMDKLYKCKNRKWILKAFTSFCGFNFEVHLKIIDKLEETKSDKLMTFIYENLGFLEVLSEKDLFKLIDKLISCKFDEEVMQIATGSIILDTDYTISMIDERLNRERYISFDEAMSKITTKDELKKLLMLVEQDTMLAVVSENEVRKVLKK